MTFYHSGHEGVNNHCDLVDGLVVPGRRSIDYGRQRSSKVRSHSYVPILSKTRWSVGLHSWVYSVWHVSTLPVVGNVGVNSCRVEGQSVVDENRSPVNTIT
jgi:hypothetical protein